MYFSKHTNSLLRKENDKRSGSLIQKDGGLAFIELKYTNGLTEY